MNEEKSQELEIDILHLIKMILEKWWLIGLVTALSLILVGGYAYLGLDDQYTAESSMIVQVTNSEDSDYTNLLTGQRLVDTYTEIAQSNRVLEALRLNLYIELTNSELRNIISVHSVNDTLIIELDVVNEDPKLAADIANEVVAIVKELSDTYDGLESVEILDTATIPVTPSGPNRMLYAAVGTLLGGGVGIGIVLAIEFLDKKLKTPKDIENILGLRLLGTIPHYDLNKEDGE